MPQSATGLWETCPSPLTISPQGLILDVQGFNLVSARAARLPGPPCTSHCAERVKGDVKSLLISVRLFPRLHALLRDEFFSIPLVDHEAEERFLCSERSCLYLFEVKTDEPLELNAFGFVIYSGCNTYYGISFDECLDLVT